jgi:transposase
MKGVLVMSEKERDRLGVMKMVASMGLKLRKAAELLGISYRQSKRIYKRYKDEGDRGLVHRLRGRISNRKRDPGEREAIVQRYRERYAGFGPTLASEKLVKEGYTIHRETLRMWLLEEGIWQKKRKGRKHRKWRERKAHRGEMVQMDGSSHDWFEGRGEEAVLMDMVDDATGNTVAQFHEEETTRAAMLTFRGYVDTYGIPLSLYVDKDTIYVINRDPTVHEQLTGEKPLTQFGRAMQKLGVKIIPANSAQAKGRVERKHGVHQDRLIKEMRLEGIRTREGGNRFLEGGYLDEINDRFAVAPASDIDLHRAAPEGLDLRTVFCFEEERMVDNDWTVRWDNRIFQIVKESRVLPPARKKVMLQEWLDGSIHIFYRGGEVTYKEINERPAKTKQTVSMPSTAISYVPPADHPWRRCKNRPMLVASPR